MERSGIQIVFVDAGKNKLTTVARLADLDISGDGVIPISVICGYRLYNAYYKYSILLLRVTSIQVVVVHLMYPYTMHYSIVPANSPRPSFKFDIWHCPDDSIPA